VEKIRARLAAVAEIKESHILRSNLRKTMMRIYDLERLSGRVALRAANPRDLVALKASLMSIPDIKSMMLDFTAPKLVAIRAQLKDMTDVVDLISRTIVDDPPQSIQDGGFIAGGCDEEVRLLW